MRWRITSVPKYLATIWSILTDPAEVGPAVKLQTLWRALPTPQKSDQRDLARAGCEAMRQYVNTDLRAKFERLSEYQHRRAGHRVAALSRLENQQYAAHRRMYDAGVVAGRR